MRCRAGALGSRPRKQLEALPESVEDLWRGENGEASGRGARSPAACRRDAGKSRRRSARRRRSRPGRALALPARSTKSRTESSLVESGLDSPHVFVCQGERPSACRQDAHRGAPASTSVASRAVASGTRSQLSRIEERASLREVLEHDGAVVTLTTGHAERVGNRGGDEAAIRRLREVCDPDAICPLACEPKAELHREACLAHASRSHDGEQPARADAARRARRSRRRGRRRLSSVRRGCARELARRAPEPDASADRHGARRPRG